MKRKPRLIVEKTGGDLIEPKTHYLVRLIVGEVVCYGEAETKHEAIFNACIAYRREHEKQIR